jgi:hypothetical protein
MKALFVDVCPPEVAIRIVPGLCQIPPECRCASLSASGINFQARSFNDPSNGAKDQTAKTCEFEEGRGMASLIDIRLTSSTTAFADVKLAGSSWPGQLLRDASIRNGLDAKLSVRDATCGYGLVSGALNSTRSPVRGIPFPAIATVPFGAGRVLKALYLPIE